ncbi:MAG: creatininase family protein [Hyphomicrobiales bacterium]
MATWNEVERYLERSSGIIIPVGSTEQHGPNGLIGTDALCAEDISLAVAKRVNGLVAPTFAYTPAPFNMSFPGTVSLSNETFTVLAREVFESLVQHGFQKLYVLNAHGANLAPLKAIVIENADITIRSWWDFGEVNAIRDELFGVWEGMHATPAEISITQAKHRVVDVPPPPRPKEPLSEEFRQAHAGDKHGPPDEHRAQFPDGRVGADSALASPAHGARLLEAAVQAISEDYQAFLAR